MTREEAIEILKEIEYPVNGDNRECRNTAFDMAIKAFENERPKGKWTPGEHECPCCGESKFKDLDADIWADWQPKYCPNCGAEMENNE